MKFVTTFMYVLAALIIIVSIFSIGVSYEKWRTSDRYDKQKEKCAEAIKIVKANGDYRAADADYLMEDCIRWAISEGD